MKKRLKLLAAVLAAVSLSACALMAKPQEPAGPTGILSVSLDHRAAWFAVYDAAGRQVADGVGEGPHMRRLPVGSYTVSFKAITDLKTPNDEKVDVATDATAEIKGIYSRVSAPY